MEGDAITTSPILIDKPNPDFLPRLLSLHYVLEGKETRPAKSLKDFGARFERLNRIVAQETINGYFISTVFLGLDHNFGLGRPILFETMIFNEDGDDEYQVRCSTYDEAVTEHRIAVGKVLARGQRSLWARVKRFFGIKYGTEYFPTAY